MNASVLLTPLNLALYAIAINFAAFAAFGFDKMLAEAGAWRISEAAGPRLRWRIAGRLRRTPPVPPQDAQQPFSRELHKIALLQLFAAVLVTGWTLAG